jgi:ABC-2 type transport system permease protein
MPAIPPAGYAEHALQGPLAELDLRRSLRGELSALAVLFGLTLRQQTRGRRLLLLIVLYALPCALAVLLRSLRRPAPTDILEFALVYNLVPHVLAPLTALLYAGGMIQDEVEEQTLTYLLVRPLPRWALYVSKLLAILLLTTLLVGAATTALYVAIYWNDSEMWHGSVAIRMLQTTAVMALGQVGYCALFGCLGVLTRRTLVAGVAYIVAFEGVLANLDFVVRKLTVVYYVRVLALRWLDLPEQIMKRWQDEWGMSDLDKVPDAGTCVLVLLGVSLAITAVTALLFARREFRMKTPEGG